MVCEATGGGGGGGGMLAAGMCVSRVLGRGGGGGGTSSGGRAEAWERAFMVSSSCCVRGVGCEAGMVSCEWLLAACWEEESAGRFGAEEGTAEVCDAMSKIWGSWHGHGLEWHLGQASGGEGGIAAGGSSSWRS